MLLPIISLLFNSEILTQPTLQFLRSAGLLVDLEVNGRSPVLSVSDNTMWILNTFLHVWIHHRASALNDASYRRCIPLSICHPDTIWLDYPAVWTLDSVNRCWNRRRLEVTLHGHVSGNSNYRTICLYECKKASKRRSLTCLNLTCFPMRCVRIMAAKIWMPCFGKARFVHSSTQWPSDTTDSCPGGMICLQFGCIPTESIPASCCRNFEV